uniref:Beta-1,4-glucuronyltransferase 1 n=1 Tax=Amblyomma sculptum TaxID=1581419 RepID=A0A1E1XN45_AMBSC
MLAAIRRSAVLDSSGEFHIVNFLARADSLLGSRNHVRPDVTLVTQSTANHLHYLVALSERWRGPLAVTVFAPRQHLALVVEVLVQLRRCVPALRYNASFHLVYPLNSPGSHQPPDASNILPQDEVSSGGVGGASPDTATPVSPLGGSSCDSLAARLQRSVPGPDNYDLGVSYPVNLLRNVARRNALTEFVLVLDVDLLPNDGLHAMFVAFARENRLFVESHRDDKTVYVAPAFEVREGVPSPRDKASLLQRVEAMDARPFYLELCWKCQKHTDYEAWQREPPGDRLAVLFEVLWRDPWEPFYFGRNSAPFYDERFRQYGFNRISQVCELHVSGYKFSVLDNAFVVHQGLKTAASFHRNKDADQERNRVLFRQFKLELREKYPDSSRRCY